jgi:ABC-type nitrate/sulfonate/bicarbonate transport system substrate-binding protein
VWVLRTMVRILCRGRLLAALAITIGSIIAGWAPAIAATLTVGKAAPNADPIIPVNVGDKLGIFKKHGLDLTIVDFTGGSKMTQAMVAGSIDIGVGAGTEMAFVAKGAPMTAICETAGPPHSSVSVCRGTPRSARSTSSKARGSAYLPPAR